MILFYSIKSFLVIDLRSPWRIGQDPRTTVKIDNFDQAYQDKNVSKMLTICILKITYIIFRQ